MDGYTENRVVIMRDLDHVFKLTNRIDLWPQLFTEYKEALVLEQDGNEIKFRLTTFSDGLKPERIWISKRYIDRENLVAHAERLDPKFPFEYMKIRWDYEQLPGNIGVVMTWIQNFNVDPNCKFNNVQMESFLNRATHDQIKAVKKNVESWKGNI